jgi:hypothetical protein
MDPEIPGALPFESCELSHGAPKCPPSLVANPDPEKAATRWGSRQRKTRNERPAGFNEQRGSSLPALLRLVHASGEPPASGYLGAVYRDKVKVNEMARRLPKVGCYGAVDVTSAPGIRARIPRNRAP